MTETKENLPLGGALIVVAFFSVAVMSALGKLLPEVPTAMLVFFQSSISLLIFSPHFLRNGFSELKTEHLSLHIVRALTGLLSQVLMFVAVQKIPLMNAVLLSNSAPLFIPLVALFWLKEKINGMAWLSILVGLVGVVFILKPGLLLFENPASGIAALAALCSAIALVSVNRLSLTESSQRILFYYFLISTLASLISLVFLPSQWRTPHGVEWLYLVGIGVAMAISQFLIILAYRYGSSEQLAPWNYSVVVSSGLLGWWIWKQAPDHLEETGILLVCIGGVLTTLYGKRIHLKVRTP